MRVICRGSTLVENVLFIVAKIGHEKFYLGGYFLSSHAQDDSVDAINVGVKFLRKLSYKVRLKQSCFFPSRVPVPCRRGMTSKFQNIECRIHPGQIENPAKIDESSPLPGVYSHSFTCDERNARNLNFLFQIKVLRRDIRISCDFKGTPKKMKLHIKCCIRR
jgi:hypothetical protein